MFIKIDKDGYLLGHDYHEHDDFSVVVDDRILVDLSNGLYLYKYVDSELVALLPEEFQSQPTAVILANSKKLQVEELRISLGIRTKACMSVLCEQLGLSFSDYQQFLADPDLTMMDRLLLNGALETVKGMVDAYTPTSYFTVDFQTAISARLAEHIAQVDAFIAS